jgi:hypothetical protein
MEDKLLELAKRIDNKPGTENNEYYQRKAIEPSNQSEI